MCACVCCTICLLIRMLNNVPQLASSDWSAQSSSWSQTQSSEIQTFDPLHLNSSALHCFVSPARYTTLSFGTRLLGLVAVQSYLQLTKHHTALYTSVCHIYNYKHLETASLCQGSWSCKIQLPPYPVAVKSLLNIPGSAISNNIEWFVAGEKSHASKGFTRIH